MSNVEMNETLPHNLMAMITLSDVYGEPFVNIAHREDDNDDTAAFSLYDYRILAGALSTQDEENEMAYWVESNAEYLLNAWYNDQLKIITYNGYDD